MKTNEEIIAFCREGKLAFEEIQRFAQINLKNVNVDPKICEKQLIESAMALEIFNKIIDWGME